MELSVLQTFVDVMKQGSFAAVARERNVDPSSVSRDIGNHTCLLFPLAGFRSTWRFKHRDREETEVFVQGHTIISNAIALQHCAIVGMGLALLPNWLIEDDLRDGRLVNVFSSYAVTATEFDTAAWLVYPSRAYVPRKVRVFIDFLKQFISG